MSFFTKNDIVDVDIPGMNKKTLLWTISLIILAILTSYGTIYYLKQRDMKLWEKERQKETQREELTEEEKKIQEISQNLDNQIYQIQITENKEIPEKTLEESAKSIDQALNQISQPKTQPKPQTTEERSRGLDSLIFK